MTLRVDAGRDSPLARPPIVGAEAVASEAQRWAKMAPLSRPAVVNGVAGAVIGRPGRPFAVVAFIVANGRITALDFVVDRRNWRASPLRRHRRQPGAAARRRMQRR